VVQELALTGLGLVLISPVERPALSVRTFLLELLAVRYFILLKSRKGRKGGGVVVKSNPEQHLPEIWSLRAMLPGKMVIEGPCWGLLLSSCCISFCVVRLAFGSHHHIFFSGRLQKSTPFNLSFANL
jgi:hypothetical protein